MASNVADLTTLAETIRRDKFASSSVLLLSGSVVRGDATESSDLDIVVIYDRVDNAQRQSFIFADWPVEAFIHDPQTLDFFFREVDRSTGVPALANMVEEGIEVPGPTAAGHRIKEMAKRVLDEGPVPWNQQDLENSRYAISDLVEDIRAPRNTDEHRLQLARLYTSFANHFCRSRGQWTGKGKGIPRRLAQLDPDLGARFVTAFEAAFSRNETGPVLHLAQEVVAPDGGFLFDGYIRDAPPEWRSNR